MRTRPVRCRRVGPRLWIADRQFCGLGELALLGSEADHFLIRRTTTAHFEPDPACPADGGPDGRGRRYHQQWGWLGRGKGRRYVRQVTLERPGQETITLVTDLTDAAAYPAPDLLEAYLMRWGIERVFQQITEVFALRRLIGGTPEATVFQCGLCLLLDNALQVVRATLAEAHGRPAESISTEQVFTDARRELVSLATLGDVGQVAEALGRGATADRSRSRLLVLLRSTWSDRWLKAPPKRKTPPHPRVKQSGAHTSVHRVFEAIRGKAGDRSTSPKQTNP